MCSVLHLWGSSFLWVRHLRLTHLFHKGPVYGIFSMDSMLKRKPCLGMNIFDPHWRWSFFWCHFACISANSQWWCSRWCNCSFGAVQGHCFLVILSGYPTGRGAFVLFQDDWKGKRRGCHVCVKGSGRLQKPALYSVFVDEFFFCQAAKAFLVLCYPMFLFEGNRQSRS